MAAINFICNNDLDDPNFGLFDISFDQDYKLSSSILMSLFTDRRVTYEEMDDGQKSRRGWWHDRPNRKLGSKLWLLKRKSITPRLLPMIKQSCEEALAWLVEDGIAAKITVDVQRHPQNPDCVQAFVTVIKSDGTTHTQNIDNIWSNL
jgi:phage gp46-like protein